jgi:uncharacterized protein
MRGGYTFSQNPKFLRFKPQICNHYSKHTWRMTMSTTQYRTFLEHLDPTVRPKRLLALDGGGIRGILSLGILKQIESLLRQRFGNDPAFRLSDYFDLIGGTSTGAIIASGLSMGMSVDEIEHHFRVLGGAIFKRSLLRIPNVVATYDAQKVTDVLRTVFGERTLASPDFRTGLMVMTKRLDTGSPWPLHNNPRGKYFGRRTDSQAIPNSNFPLWRVIRASTAAPTYFDPEYVQITEDSLLSGMTTVTGEFVDGGVSTANNPALQLLMLATMEGHGFIWDSNPDNLLLVSIGTGRLPPKRREGIATGSLAGLHAVRSLISLMDDCADLVETTLQWLSHSPTAREIDRATRKAGPVLGQAPQLSYLRYNAVFDSEWCRDTLAIDFAQDRLNLISELDAIDGIDDLYQIGVAVGKHCIESSHFARPFDQGVLTQ